MLSMDVEYGKRKRSGNRCTQVNSLMKATQGKCDDGK